MPVECMPSLAIRVAHSSLTRGSALGWSGVIEILHQVSRDSGRTALPTAMSAEVDTKSHGPTRTGTPCSSRARIPPDPESTRQPPQGHPNSLHPPRAGRHAPRIAHERRVLARPALRLYD